MNNKKRIISMLLIFTLIVSLHSITFAKYESALGSLGNMFGNMGSAIDKAEKGDTSGALNDYFNAFGDLANTATELSKTTVLEDVQEYEKQIDNFIKYLDTIDDKIKEQKTSNDEKKKINKVLDRIKQKLKTLVVNETK